MRCAIVLTFLTRWLVERVGICYLRDVPGIDFAGASPILTKKQYCGGAAMAESAPNMSEQTP
jgi:hypothetical protein